MDYHAHYNRLISRARSRVLEGYFEGHHVVPKCLGGSDTPDNIVYLTAEEHFVAHLLLVKMHPANGKLAWAAYMMTVSSKTHVAERSRNKLYGWLRRRISSEAKKRTGEKNGSFGTMWITNGTDSQKNDRSHKIPSGWKPGRVIVQSKTIICEHCKNAFVIRKRRRFCSTLCRVNALWTGKTHTDSTKQKIRAAMTGTRWITNGIINTKLNQLDEMPDGFRFGQTRSKKPLS